MKKITELNHAEAHAFFLNAKSFFRQDFPPYISFQPILDAVHDVLSGSSYSDFRKPKTKPENLPGVNYQLTANKDGRFGWRPLEVIHPAIYVSLVNVVCEQNNWQFIKDRFAEMQKGAVICCSYPVCP